MGSKLEIQLMFWKDCNIQAGPNFRQATKAMALGGSGRGAEACAVHMLLSLYPLPSAQWPDLNSGPEDGDPINESVGPPFSTAGIGRWGGRGAVYYFHATVTLIFPPHWDWILEQVIVTDAKCIL